MRRDKREGQKNTRSPAVELLFPPQSSAAVSVYLPSCLSDYSKLRPLGTRLKPVVRLLFCTEALLSGLTAWLPREPGGRDTLTGQKRFQVSSNMERGAEAQRGGDREAAEEKALAERQWGEAEVLALLSVWDEVGAQHVAESRATFELISERLRRLSIVRSWWECQDKCRSLGLQQSRKRDAAAGYIPGLNGRPREGWDEEPEDVGDRPSARPRSLSIPAQEGKCKFDQMILSFLGRQKNMASNKNLQAAVVTVKPW